MIAVKDNIITAASICLNAVYVKPYRAKRAEDFIIGKLLNKENAKEAGEVVASDSKPLKQNGYMVQIANTMVKRAILACGEDVSST